MQSGPIWLHRWAIDRTAQTRHTRICNNNNNHNTKPKTIARSWPCVNGDMLAITHHTANTASLLLCLSAELIRLNRAARARWAPPEPPALRPAHNLRTNLTLQLFQCGWGRSAVRLRKCVCGAHYKRCTACVAARAQQTKHKSADISRCPPPPIHVPKID